MRTKFLFFSLLMVFCSSCMYNEKIQVGELVKEWNQKEILFPKEAVFTRFISDTVCTGIPRSKNKVVIFVDSAGCLSCKLQLTKWKRLMDEVDSLCPDSVPFLFFFESGNVRELQALLKRDNFAHPICLDTYGAFNALNHFPDQLMFQSFLLDSANRVKIIGNPIHNLSVKELYMQELVGVKSLSMVETMIQSDSAAYHYGNVGLGTPVKKMVVLRNTGHEVFHLKGITTSCDCLTAECDWKEIQPGGSASMTVQYTADSPGDFMRFLTIYGNVPAQSISLEFWGTAEP